MLIWLGVGRFVTTFLQCRGEWSRQGHKLKTTTEPYESKEEKKKNFYLPTRLFHHQQNLFRVFFFSISLSLDWDERRERMKILFLFVHFFFVFLNLGTILMKSVVCDGILVKRWFLSFFTDSFLPLLFSPVSDASYTPNSIPFWHTRFIESKCLFFAYAWLRSSFVIENCMFCSGYSPKASINIPVTTECALSCPV